MSAHMVKCFRSEKLHAIGFLLLMEMERMGERSGQMVQETHERRLKANNKC